SGGTIRFDTSPLGMSAAPATAMFSGNMSGCAGTPAPDAALHGNFTGTGSCWDVSGPIDGTLTWSNGKVSRISGQWHVPGGLGARTDNTVNIVDGPGAGG